MNWRKLNRVLHRDFGYFFTATTIIYALSGIALNHMNDWNPNYIINSQDIKLSEVPQKDQINEQWVLDLIDQYDDRDNFKKFYFPKLKSFFPIILGSEGLSFVVSPSNNGTSLLLPKERMLCGGIIGSRKDEKLFLLMLLT